MNELAQADEKALYSLSVHTDPGGLFSVVYTVKSQTVASQETVFASPTVYSQQLPESRFLPQLQQNAASSGSLPGRD